MRESAHDISLDTWKQWILEAISKIRSQKQRPSVQRICQAIGSHHKFHEDIVAEKLEEAVESGAVIKVYNKGLHSYKAPMAKRRIKVEKNSNLCKVVAKAVHDLGECEGSTIKTIENYIQKFNNIDLGPEVDFRAIIKSSIKKAVDAGFLIQDGKLYKKGRSLTTPRKASSTLEVSVTTGDDNCSYCSGDAQKNRNGIPEPLSSCKKCGMSLHTTCANIAAKCKSQSYVLLYMLVTKGSIWYCTNCVECSVCTYTDRGPCLLECSACKKMYHLTCLDTIPDKKPKHPYRCKTCLSQNVDVIKKESKKSALDAGKIRNQAAKGMHAMIPSTSEYAGVRGKEWPGGKSKDKRNLAAAASCKRQIIDEIDESPTTSKLSKYDSTKELYKDISLSQAIKSSQNFQKTIAHNSHLKMFKQRRQFAGLLKMEPSGESKRTKKQTPTDLSSSSSSSDSEEDDNMEFDDDNQDDSTSSGSCSSSSSGSDSSESSSDSSEFDNEENDEENDDDDCDSDKSESKSNIFISQISVKKEINVPTKNYTTPENNKPVKDEHWGFAAVAKNRVDIFSQSRSIESDGFALKKCGGNLLTGFNKNLVTDEANATNSKQANYNPVQTVENETDQADKKTHKVTAKKDNLPQTTTTAMETPVDAAPAPTTAAPATPAVEASAAEGLAKSGSSKDGSKKPVEKVQKKKIATLKSAPLDTKKAAYKSDDDEVPYLDESAVIKYQMLENTEYARSVKPPFPSEESCSNEKVEYEEVYPDNPFETSLHENCDEGEEIMAASKPIP